MQLLRLLSRISFVMLATAILASVLSGFAAMGALICVFESLRSGNVLWWQFALAAGICDFGQGICACHARSTGYEIGAASAPTAGQIRLARSAFGP